jgi:hypothetical protein
MSNNGNIIVETMNEEAAGVTIKSKVSKRNVHFRESVNPATAGQFVLGVTESNGSTERNVVVRADDTEELLETMLGMVQQGTAAYSTQEQRLTGNVYITTATPRIAKVTYQSHISGRKFSLKASASKKGQWLFTATGADGYPDASIIVKANDTEAFLEAALDIIG